MAPPMVLMLKTPPSGGSTWNSYAGRSPARVAPKSNITKAVAATITAAIAASATRRRRPLLAVLATSREAAGTSASISSIELRVSDLVQAAFWILLQAMAQE